MLNRLMVFVGITTLFILPGCVSAPVDAPYYARITEFEDLEIPWVGCRRDQGTGELENPNCVPSDPIIIRVDSRVYNDQTGLPMNNIRIWYTSTYNRVYLLPQEVLEAIELPETTSGGWHEATQDQQELWAEFAGTFEDDYRPTYHEGYTDGTGVSTVWVYIESMPTDEQGQAIQTSINVAIASDAQVIPLTAGQ